jgi:hypothetical protein
MRMSHIYQPVMLLELLRNDGSASVEQIATAFAATTDRYVSHVAPVDLISHMQQRDWRL